jgi:hypothetical protein
MALLGERAQPDEQLVDDTAEPASHDEPVEHGRERVSRRVERLDPHRCPIACGRREMGRVYV